MSKSILGLIGALFLSLQLRAEQPIFNISSMADVTNGQIINIDMHVDNFSQLVAIQMSVNWNPTVLKFKSIKNLNASVNGLAASSFNTTSYVDQGKFTLAWFEPGTNQITIPDGSLFYTIEFEVVGNPCQNSTIAITEDPLETLASEDGNNDIGLLANSGTVSVQGTGCSADLTVTGTNITAACNSNACVSFAVQNFNAVGAMDFSVIYDPTVLTFSQFQNYGPLPGFGNGNTNLVSPGNLRVVWTDSNAENDSLPDGTVLFEICFDVIGTTGQSSNVTFAAGNDPNGLIFNIDGEPHTLTLTPASITAQCALEGFALIIDSTYCTTPNGIICVDVKVNDFDDIVAAQLSMNWDSTKFTFDHLEAFGLPDLNTGTFAWASPTTPGVKKGQLTMAWLDMTLEGVSVPDFSTIFRLCLKAIGPVGSSSTLTFSEIPLEFEILNAADSLLQPAILPGVLQIKQSCDVNPPCQISYTINPTPPNCPRESNGSIDLNVTTSGECTGTLSYLWSNGLPTQDLTGIPAGSYIVTITLGSQTVIASVTVTDPPAIEVTGTITNPSAPNAMDGGVDITVTGGTPPYTFVWNSTPMQLKEDLTNVKAGTYTVTITDSKGCTFIPDPFIVGADFRAEIHNVSCFGGSDGSINITGISFGTQPYTFVWSPNGEHTQNISNLKTGTYCVTITDFTGSTRDSCFNITQSATPVTLTATITDDINEDSHGAIDLNVLGGTPPYTYIWNNGSTAQDLINLVPGVWCVTVSSSGGLCTVDTCFTVHGANGGAVNVILNAQQYGGGFETSCFGTCDGSITPTVSGGNSPFTYHWNNGASSPGLTGLCAGIYSVTVTDADGETAVSTITLVSPPSLTLSLLTTIPSDPTATDGAISAVVSGGVPGYIYQWNPAAGNVAALNNLPSGLYSLTVTDANQCTVTQTTDLFIDGCFKGLKIITPNSDGKNDFFIISCIFSAPNHLSIYNRFGGLVYETDNYMNNWTGVDEDNQPIPDGGYLWVLEVRPQGMPAELLKGTVNVLRTAD